MKVQVVPALFRCTPVVLLFAASLSVARAQLTNGSFETGDFTGWVTGGNDVTVGQSQVYNSGGINWTIGPAASNMAVLQPNGALDYNATMAALNLSSDSKAYFDSVFPDPTNFAYIYQSFHLDAGETLTMGWNYLATDYSPYNDASFATFVNLDSPSSLGKINGGLAQINVLGATVTGGNYNTGDYGSSGWQTATFEALVAGTYQLGAVVFNLSDTAYSPYLFIDAVGGTTLKNGATFDPIPPAPDAPPPPTPVAKIDTTNGDISASVFSLTSDAAVASPVQFAGGTLQMSGGSTVAAPVSIEASNAYVDNNNGSGGFSGDVSGSGSLNVSGGGTFTLSGSNSYSGGTTASGTTLAAGSNTAFGTGSIGLTNSTLSGAQSLSNNISLIGADTINVASGTQMLSGVISGAGTLTKTGAGTSTLSGNNTYTGSTTVSDGTLNINGTLASTSLTVANGGTMQTGGANLLSDSANLTVNSGGTFNLGGNDMIGQLNGAGAVGLSSHQLTVGSGSFSGTAGGTGGLTKAGSGTLTLSGANTYTGSTLVQAGTLQLDGSLASQTVTISSGATVNNTNSGFASDAAFTNAGTLNLSLDDTVSTVVNSGTLNGPGKLNATSYALNNGSIVNASLGAGTLNSNGNVALNGTSDAGTVNVQTGTLSLGSAERLADTANVTISSGANLGLGGDEKIDQLNGAGSVALGAGKLTVNSGTFSGSIGGTGELSKTGSGTLALSGASTYSGATTVQAGTLDLSGSLASTSIGIQSGATLNNSNGGLAAGATVTNAGTVVLGANDTISTLTNSGTIDGTGTLTAVTYGLNSGSAINANLGTGTVNSNGSVALNGTSAAAAVNVQTGTLTLGGANRLSDSADLTIDSGAQLALGGDDTVSSLNNSGTLGGTGTLTAVTYGLNNGSAINANLGTGTVNSNGSVALNGTSAAAAVNVQTGTLTLGGADRLADTADVTVSFGANLALGGNDTIGQLNGAGDVSLGASVLNVGAGAFGGTLQGTGGLTKSGAGTLGLSGLQTYTGSTTVSGGTLQLDGSLASAAIDIAAGATVNNTNSGFASNAAFSNAGTLNLSLDDTVATVVSSGTLNGPGKLNASSYALNNGSIVNGNLGAGTVTTNGTVALNGTSDATTVTVQSGTLTTGAAERFADSVNLTVDGGAGLDLGGNETIDQLNGNGAVALNANTLTVSSGNFGGGLSGTGGVTKNGPGTLTLGGANTYTGDTKVQAGKVDLNGTLDSNTVTVSFGGTLNNASGGLKNTVALDNAGTVVLGADQAVGSFTNSGTLDGSSTLTTNNYVLNHGSVINANLGAGTVTSNGSVALNGTSGANSVTIVTGTLTTGSGERFSDSADVAVSSGASLNLGGSETIDQINGNGSVALNTNTLVVSSGSFGGTIGGSGGLVKNGPGALNLTGPNTYTGSTFVQGGTLDLDGSLGSSAVTVSFGSNLNSTNGGLSGSSTLTNAGFVNLGADDTVAGFTNSGTINGPGKLNAATYALNHGSVINANLGGGIVTSNGSVLLNGTSDASIVNVETGALTLGSGERLADGARLTVSNDAGLNLGGDEKIGSLNGGGNVSIGINLLTVSEGYFSGAIDGTGSLDKVDGGTLTLAGPNTYTGGMNVQGGSLTLDGSLASPSVTIADGATLTNNSGGLADNTMLTNAGLLVMNANDTIGSLLNSGTINGGSTLTAVTYDLNNGSVINAHLGGGVLTSNGSVALNGTSAAGTVNIQSGTLSTGSSDRLSDGANVTVSSGAALALGGNEAIDQINGSGSVDLNISRLTVSSGNFGGVMSGSGDLVKTSSGTLVLTGDNTFTGKTLVASGTLNLDGSLASGEVAVNEGSTLNSTHGGLIGNAVLQNAGTVNLGADDTIATFVNTGTLNGPGKLNASTYALNGGSVINANLGGGTVMTNGNVLLNGTSDAANVTVQSGTLTLGDAERLSSSASLGLSDGATLKMNGNQTVGTFTSKGHLAGNPGDTLTASLYDLRDGTVIDGNLGHGTLTSNGSVLLNGLAAAEIIKVQSGALTLGAPDRLGDYAWVDVTRDARLVLANGNDTVRLLTGDGDVNLHNGSVLTVLEGDYNGNATSTGALLKDHSTTLTLSGVSTYEKGTIVRDGDLFVSNGGQLTSDVTVEQHGTFHANGSIAGGVNVDQGGRLLGNGTITSNVVNRGTVVPGDASAPLKISGSYSEFGTLSFGLGEQGGERGLANGPAQLVVDGAISLNPGSTLQLTRAASSQFEPARGQAIRLFAADRIDGEFSVLDRSAFSTQVLFDYATGRIVGTGLPEGASFAELGGASRNGRSLVGALFGGTVARDTLGHEAFIDSRTKAGKMALTLLAMPSMTDSLDALSPEPFAGLADYSLYATRNYSRESGRTPTLVSANGWRIGGGYSNYRTGTRSSESGADYDLKSMGGNVTVSKDLGRNALFGAYFAADCGSVDAARLNYDAEGTATGVYGTYALRDAHNVRVDAGASYGHYSFDGSRSSLFGRTAGRTDSKAYDVWTRVQGDAVKVKGVTLSPFVGVAHTRSEVEAFLETGAADAFAIKRAQDRRTVGEAGLDAAFNISRRLGVSFSGGFEHNFAAGQRDVKGVLQMGGTDVAVSAPGFDRDAIRLGGSASYAITRKLSVSLYGETAMAKNAHAAQSFGIRSHLSF
jgi:autotransporter-associated beta strand protein